MTEYRAPILTIMALHWMRKKFPDAMLTTELAVAKYGEASIDVGAITETAIYGVEVKGNGDSTSRLLRQGWVYSRAAYQMWLLPAPSLEKGCKKHKPQGWGMLHVDGDSLDEVQRVHAEHPLPNAAATLLSILWKPEILKLSRELGLSFKQSQTCHVIEAGMAEELPLSVIRPKVCQILRKRKWHQSQFPKTVYHPNDELPLAPPGEIEE